MNQVGAIRQAVATSLARSPVVGVVRTKSFTDAFRQASLFAQGGIELVEVTFTVPQAVKLVSELLDSRRGGGPPWFGMGTVTTLERARSALAAGAEFIVSPNTNADVADTTLRADTYLILGALTPTEICRADQLGADIVKVYPLPPVGGAAYLRATRQPLDDIPMLAAGGFGVEEIPEYRSAGARAFGIGPPLVGATDEETLQRIDRALHLARKGVAP